MKSSTSSLGLKKTQKKNNVGLVVVVGGGGGVGRGGCEETKFMAQNVTLTRNATTCQAKCYIKS